MSTTNDAASLSQPAPSSEGFWLRIIYITSALVVAAVAFLFWGPRPEGTAGTLDVSMLPVVNATLNGVTTVLLLIGFVLIKQRRIPLHRQVMLAAFASSAAFMVTYVIYHWYKPAPRAYVGDYREIYLVILITHIVLAAIIVPLALVTLYRGWTMQRPKHRKLARITFPVWLYVSVTGVLIYLMHT